MKRERDSASRGNVAEMAGSKRLRQAGARAEARGNLTSQSAIAFAGLLPSMLAEQSPMGSEPGLASYTEKAAASVAGDTLVLQQENALLKQQLLHQQQLNMHMNAIQAAQIASMNALRAVSNGFQESTVTNNVKPTPQSSQPTFAKQSIPRVPSFASLATASDAVTSTAKKNAKMISSSTSGVNNDKETSAARDQSVKGGAPPAAAAVPFPLANPNVLAKQMLLAHGMMGLNPLTGILNPMIPFPVGTSGIAAGVPNQSIEMTTNKPSASASEDTHNVISAAGLDIQKNLLKMQSFLKAQTEAQSRIQHAYLKQQQQLFSFVNMQNQKNLLTSSQVSKQTRSQLSSENNMKQKSAKLSSSSKNASKRKRLAPQVAKRTLAPARAKQPQISKEAPGHFASGTETNSASDGVHPLLVADKKAKLQKARERGKYASALFRKKLANRTQMLERHSRALGRAKKILINHHWGKHLDSDPKGITKGLKRDTKESAGVDDDFEDRISFLNRALYSLNLADLTLSDPTTNMKMSGTGEDILQNLMSAVNMMKWRSDMALGRVQSFAKLTSQFNATGRTLYASNLTQVHRFVTLIKLASSLTKNEKIDGSRDDLSPHGPKGRISSDQVSKSGSSSQMSTTGPDRKPNFGPERYSRKTLADFAKSGIQKKEETRQALLAELAQSLDLTETQVISIKSLETCVAKRELLLQVLGKSFRAVRSLASVVCNLQHKCNVALNHLLLPGQLESFLKAVYVQRHAVSKVNLLENDRVSTGDKDMTSKGQSQNVGEIQAKYSAVAERNLDATAVVGIDSESGLSATEDFVQRREALVSTLAQYAAALNEQEGNRMNDSTMGRSASGRKDWF